MSELSTLVGSDHFRYIAEHTTAEDAFLKQLKEAAAAAGIPAIWIAPEQASFMRILLKVAKARDVVEVGTLAGYSAISMARALPPEGRVRTIEIAPMHADFAEQWVARSDVAGASRCCAAPEWTCCRSSHPIPPTPRSSTPTRRATPATSRSACASCGLAG
jgi:predicted O-methyltransferase YrrM